MDVPRLLGWTAPDACPIAPTSQSPVAWRSLPLGVHQYHWERTIGLALHTMNYCQMHTYSTTRHVNRERMIGLAVHTMSHCKMHTCSTTRHVNRENIIGLSVHTMSHCKGSGPLSDFVARNRAVAPPSHENQATASFERVHSNFVALVATTRTIVRQEFFFSSEGGECMCCSADSSGSSETERGDDKPQTLFY